MLTFMSHPETTCSSSHLRACSSVGKCWLVVFRKPSWPYSCGGRPGAAPFILPNTALALEAASGFWGAWCLWVWTHLGDRETVVRTSHHGSTPLGSHLTTHSMHNRVWKMPELAWPVGGSARIQTRPPDSPGSSPPHRPPRPGMARAEERGPARMQQATCEPRGGSTCPPPCPSRQQC